MELNAAVVRTTGTVQMMKKTLCLLVGLFAYASMCFAQMGSDATKEEANKLFANGEFAEAMPLFSQLVSLDPADHVLNYKLGTCIIYSGENKESAIGFLKYSIESVNTPSEAFFYLGRAQQLTYRFQEALASFDNFQSKADKKTLARLNVVEAKSQCQNGLKLLSNIKDVRVLNKLEVDVEDFFRFYDLENIGGKIVITPEELKSSYDKKKDLQSLVYLPAKGGAIYFASYGKDGSSGKDIYRSELRPDGRFMPPVKLPSNVNTDADEDHAFMHPDGSTFYFSSKGHSSMGGYDVFKCKYDGVRDFFGQAENMDFAVNTPDDDILYLVDPDGQEACFASARQSAQGSIHVYRVETNQVPLSLTILKGTFKSDIEPSQTDARIVVEDAVSHETIGTYNTENDGSYIISIPRSGKYKFMVTPSSSGKTHLGLVEIPRSESSNAYKQELTLIEQGGQEKLIIKNFFDETLDEDLLALAQEEIRRRALLDVNGPSEVEENEAPLAANDPLRQAGFAPDVTLEDAMALATKEAQELEAEVAGLSGFKENAYGIAEEQTDAARNFQEEAEKLAGSAQLPNGEVDEALMEEAALFQLRSLRASERARAAEQLGVELDGQHGERSSEALELTRLSSQIGILNNGQSEEAVVAMLSDLKTKINDRNSGKETTVNMRNAIRSKATDLEEKATRQLERVLERSNDENDLINRINRLKREQESLKGKKRALNEEQRVQYEKDLAEVTASKDKYKAKAQATEKEAAIARQQVELLELLTSGRAIDAPVVSAQRKADLPAEISQIEQETEDLPIEDRFREEAIIQMGDVADSEAAVTAVLPDSFEVPNASDTQVSLTETLETQIEQTEGTEVMEVAAVDNSATDVLAVAEVEELATEALSTEDVSAEETEVLAQDRPEQSITDFFRSQDPVVEENENAQQVDASVGLATENDTSSNTQDVLVESTSETAPVSIAELNRSNRIAELTQLREVTNDEAELAEIDKELEDLSNANETTLYDAILDGYTPEMSDSDLENTLGLYVYDNEDITASPEEKVSIEQKKIAVLDSKIAQQKEALSTNPVDLVQRQELLSRLQEIKAQHKKRIDALESSNETPIAVLAPVNEEGDFISETSGITNAENSGASAVERNYIAINREPTKVYQSNVNFRSEQIGESRTEYNNLITGLDVLQEEVDSLEAVKAEFMPGSDYDKITKRIDKKIDDGLIARTEIGMRSAYFTKQEFKYLNDSLALISKQSDKVSGAASARSLAEEFNLSATSSFDNAKRIRKQAERTMDIVEKDQLYRQAYDAELNGLGDLARSITVQNYINADAFEHNQEKTIVEIEQIMFGTPDVTEVLAVEPEAPSNETETVEEVMDLTSSISPEDYNGLEGEALADEIALLETISANENSKAKRLFAEAQTLYSKAQMLEDSAANVRKRKVRESIEAEALLLRKKADRTMEVAQLAKVKGSTAQVNLEALLTQQRTKKNFKKYFLLTPDVHTVIQEDVDYYQYFEARSNAMELISEANERENEELANRTLADMYMNEVSQMLRGEDTQSEGPGEEEIAKAKVLNDQAAALISKADSLNKVVVALRSKAKLQNQIAEKKLIEVGPQKADEILQLESVIAVESPEQELIALEEENDVELPVMAPGSIYNSPEAARAAREAAAQLETLKEETTVENETVLAEETIPVANELAAENSTFEETVGQEAEDLNVSEEEAITEVTPAVESDALTEIFEATENVEVGENLEESTERATLASSNPKVEDMNDPLTEAIAIMPGAAIAEAAPAKPVVDESGMLMADVFYLGNGDVTGQVAYNSALPRGVVFKVQVGAFSKRVPDDLYGEMDPVMGEDLGSGLVRYTAGLFMAYSSAADAKTQVRGRGYDDAFVVAFIDGKRVTIAEAEAQLSIDRPQYLSAPIVQQSSDSEGNVLIGGNTTKSPDNALVPAETTVEETVPETVDVVALPEYDMSALNTSYGDDPNAAPAAKVETIKGLFYTVQVGVYSNPVALDKLFNITPLNTELIRNNMIRYTTGRYGSLDAAVQRKEETRTAGVTDAFVTAYMNGKRISVSEAKGLLTQHGSGILAK